MKKPASKERNTPIQKLSSKRKFTLLRLLLIIGVLVFTLFILYVVSLVNLNYKLDKTVKKQESAETKLSENNQSSAPKISNWTGYENKELGFSIEVPSDLMLSDSGPHGDYYDFVRFEETASSLSKGVMIGVSQDAASNVVSKVKSDFQKSGDAKLAEEKNIVLNGFPATRLYYRPAKENSGLEERVIVVVQNDKFSYSISTIPEQMARVIEGFKFVAVSTDPTGVQP